MPSASPTNPASTISQARRPISFEKPAKLLRTVPPSSMVRRLVASPSVDETLITSAICSRVALRSLATATAAPTVPQVPCGCIVTRSFDAMPTRELIAFVDFQHGAGRSVQEGRETGRGSTAGANHRSSIVGTRTAETCRQPLHLRFLRTGGNRPDAIKQHLLGTRHDIPGKLLRRHRRSEVGPSVQPLWPRGLEGSILQHHHIP